jgi:hypothetical protein
MYLGDKWKKSRLLVLLRHAIVVDLANELPSVDCLKVAVG